MLNLAPKSKYKGGTVPRWPKSAARLPGPAGELAGSVCFMENQRLEECWPGRRRWKGEAFVPCTRAWPGVREIPERDRVQRAARQRWDGLRGEGIPPAPGLRCREAGVAPWWLPPAAGDGLGAPPAGPPCAIIPLGDRPAEGAQAVPPWGGGTPHRAGRGAWPCASSAVPRGTPALAGPIREPCTGGLGNGTLPQRGARVHPAWTQPA